MDVCVRAKARRRAGERTGEEIVDVTVKSSSGGADALQ
jgi:hypothetical protein